VNVRKENLALALTPSAFFRGPPSPNFVDNSHNSFSPTSSKLLVNPNLT